jgi:ribosome biogenesis GTPase
MGRKGSTRGAYDRYDESDVRTRPNPRGSRPRSKRRPNYEEAVWGIVMLVDRGRFRVRLPGDGAGPDPEVIAMRARELGRRALVVGDRVGVVGDTSGRVDTLARIVALADRATTLRRTADDTDPVERVIVANAEQLAVVVAAADPEPRIGFVDRAIIAGYDGGLRPFIVVTKTDLAAADAVRSTYSALDIPVVPVQRGGDLEPLKALLEGRSTVLIGQSGVGKSTLVNALVPAAERATGSVNAVTGRGRHTSTSVQAIALPGGGWIIDTPGVRSFGLAHVDLARIMHAFHDLEPGTADCPRACTHLDEHCALDAYAASGAAGPGAVDRLASLRRVLGALSAAGEPE